MIGFNLFPLAPFVIVSLAGVRQSLKSTSRVKSFLVVKCDWLVIKEQLRYKYSFDPGRLDLVKRLNNT